MRKLATFLLTFFGGGTIQLPPNSTGTVLDTVTLAARDREIIVVGGDGAAAEVGGVVNTQPAETEYGLVTRPIQRVDGETLSTTPLGVSGVFTQTGQDRNADGVMFVQAAARSDVASATDGFVIQEYDLADDFVDANFVRTVAAASVPAGGNATRIAAVIRARRWRVRYTNGGTAQTSFTLAAAAQPFSEAGLADFDSGTGTQLLPLTGIALPASGGAVAGGTSAAPIRIDPTGTTTQPVSVVTALPAGANNIGDVDVLSMPTGASATAVQGDVASGAADSGSPVKMGGRAFGALPTAVAADQRVNAYLDREGRQIVRPWGAGAWSNVNFPAANTRASSTRAAGAAGVRHVCTGITVALAAGATAPAAVQLDVRLRDGILDTGTILWQMAISIPATAGAMSGVTRSGLFIPGSAATAMTLEFSAAGGANTFESVSFEGIDITEA